ncbi:MAG: hypothetical protein AAFV27_09070 [Pseudomonadota bacterium]
MYDGDSLFTLSVARQTGVVILSAVMAVLTLKLVIRLSHERTLWLRVGAAILGFVLFVTLSPQIYYEYYRLVLDGLPAQWVIRLPDPAWLLRLVTFQDRVTLSDHGKGLLFWLLVLFAVRSRRV